MDAMLEAKCSYPELSSANPHIPGLIMAAQLPVVVIEAAVLSLLLNSYYSY